MAEIEYHDVTSESAFISEQVKDGKGLLGEDTYLVAWTTTPWTVPASQALAVHPDFKYVQVQPKNVDKKYLVAESLLTTLSEKFGWEEPEFWQL